MLIYLNWKTKCEAFGRRIKRLKNLDRRSRIFISAAVLGVLAVLAWNRPALAALADNLAFVNVGGRIGDLFLIVLTGVVLLFLNLMMIMSLLLTKLLIAVASYNNFVAAAAVTTGWPLVRDVANMFFIVVLLIIAFSTIIGYKEMDYKKYVPRLLLMAVLINFSKTLIGLLIDFSQVIMLTFVNGFKEAAFGNFVKMFGLQNVFTIAQSNTVEAIAKTSNLFIAAIFGVIMLSVVSTTLLIMVIYFVARIIALWIILIFSPMAFFVWALPPKLQKSLSRFSNDWWGGLASWLSGGPIVAFFLWLTMAIVAANDSPFKDIMPNDAETDFLRAAITKAANPDDIARFIVAIALLMMGLKQAVEVSRQASASLGAAASKIKAAGGPIGYPAKLGARAAGKVGAAGVKFADQKFGVTQKLGRGISEMGLAAGQKGGALGSLVGGLGVKYGQQIEGISGARAAASAKGHEAIAKNLPPTERNAYYGMLSRSATPDVAASGQRFMVRDRFEPDAKESRIAGYAKSFEAMGASKDDAKAMAAHKDRQETIASLKAAKDNPELMGDRDFKKFVDDKYKEDPSLNADYNKVREEVRKKKGREITPEMRQSLDVIQTELEDQGFIKDGKLDAKAARSSDWYKKAKQTGGNGFLQLEAGIAAIERTPALATGPTGIRLAAQGDGSVQQTRYDSASNAYTGGVLNKTAGVENMLTSAGMPAAQAATTAQRFSGISDQSQARAVNNAFNAGAYSGTAPVATAAAEMANVQKSGVPTAQAFGVQSGGNYETPAFQAAHAAAMSSAVADIPANIQFIVTIDPQIITGGGAAAATVATALSGPDVLDNAVAAVGKDKALQAKMQGVVKAIADAGAESERRIAAGVAEAADTAMAAARAKVMGNKATRNMAYPPAKKKKK